MSNGNHLLTIKEVASYCQVKKDTIRRWVKEENFPHLRATPTVLRFVKKDVLEWLSNRTELYTDTIIREESNA